MVSSTKNRIKEILSDEFSARSFRNPNYSLRSYSRDLKINVSTLSRLMRGEMVPSGFIVDRVAEKLKLDAEMVQLINQEIGLLNDLKVTKTSSENAILHISSNSSQLEILKMHIAPAFLEYLRIAPTPFNNQAAATYFKVSVEEIVLLQDYLLEKELIVKNAEGGLVENFDCLVFELPKDRCDYINSIHTFFHERSVGTLAEFSPDLWIQTAFTIAIDDAIIPEVRERVKVFLRELSGFIDSKSKNANNVYTFQSSLFPWGKGRSH